jgi:hypothetical protein
MSRPHLLSDQDLEGRPGEHLLFMAVLDRLAKDLSCPTPLRYGAVKVGGRTTMLDQLLAIEEIIDDEGGLAEWTHLIGLDAAAVREQVLRAAGFGDLIRPQ